MEHKNKEGKKNNIGRAPVVTIMGHVDHGKTTLLDYIRKTKVAEREHGGITQHISSYQVDIDHQKITFIDTPGHEAFSAMRARGANATDIAILVVAADDGVMPQTKESISHIKAAGIPMIVAINKMDLPGANVDRVKKGLSENGVAVEGYGGDVVTVPISAKTGDGVDDLLEMIMLVAEMTELKDEFKKPFEAVVIESSLDKFRGPVATILVKKGSIKVGDLVKTPTISGKVRALINSNGDQVKEAIVSMPVQILGLEKVPAVGDVLALGTKSQTVVEEKTVVKKTALEKLAEPKTTEINLVIKADVAGSLEAICAALENLGDSEHKINIIHKETGEVSESDVLLAASTKAIIIGFNVKVSKAAEKLSDEEKVMIRNFNIIYQLLDELKEGLEMLVNAKKEQVLGKGNIIQVFDTSFGRVAGTKVTEGRLNKGDRISLYRDEEKITSAKIKSIRHLQEEVNTAKEGLECGVLLEGKAEVAVGDIIVAVA